MRNHALLPCLLASGATGLAYELLWTRLLSLSFGSTTLSFSTVLAVFFGGMALGSWLAGRVVHRLKRPVRAYGLIEAALGVLGLLTYPAMVNLDHLLAWLSPETTFAIGLVRILLSGLLLAAPTVLMGATLPVVSRAVIHSDGSIGSGTALIYGLNTIGAFIGTYLVTFQLLPAVGLFATMLLTVATNIAVAACAITVDRRAVARATGAGVPAPGPEAFEPSQRSVGVARLAALLTFLNGFALISLEVVWSRTYASLLQGTVYALGAVLMAVLAGIGLGSFAWSRLAPRARHNAVAYVVLQSITVLSVAVVFWYFTPLAYLLESLSGYKGPAAQHYQLLAVIACLIVPTFCSGASLPLLVQLVETRASHSSAALGSLLAANTVGAIAGSLMTGFVLIPRIASPGSVTLALALLATSALLAAGLLCRGSARAVAALMAAPTLVVLAGFDGYDNQIAGTARQASQSFGDYLARQASERKVFFAEGRDGTISVTLGRGMLGLQLNGLGQGGRNLEPPHYVFESALLAVLALLHSDGPDTAMVVGLGAGVSVDALSKSGVGEVTVLEIEERVPRAVEVIWQGETPLDLPGVRLVVDDARHHLVVNARAGGERYDIIASMPSHPWVAPNIFTREFFELVAQSLAERGVFVSWFGYQGLDGPTVKSLFRAFAGAFPHYFIYEFDEVGAYYLVGSRDPLRFDVGAVERLGSNDSFGRRDLIGDPVFLASHVHARGDGENAALPPGPVNSDDTAFVETRAPRPTRLPPVFSRFFPREFLDPSAVITTGEPRAFFIDLLETLLGTPDGRLPVGPVAAQPGRAASTLGACASLLTPTQRDYYAGRALVLTPATRSRGLDALARIAQGEDAELAARARLFAALAHPQFSQERREALVALPPSRGAALVVLDELPSQWRRFAPEHAISAEEDPVGWLLSRRSTEKIESAELRRLLGEEVIPALLTAHHPHLLALAEAIASEHGWHPEAELLQGRVVDLSRGRAADLRAAAASAANKGEHAHALVLLREALELSPSDATTLETLVEVATRSGDESALADATRLYVTLGRSPEYVAALAGRARASGLGHLQAQVAQAPLEGEP